MKNYILKTSLSNNKKSFGYSVRLMNNFYSCLSRNIFISHNKNYFEPTSNEEELEEVKDWLSNYKPKYLCVFFTNNWNPVCQEANTDFFNKFTTKSGSFKNLRVDVDKFPRLKWFFDSKFEPGFHFYYYGNFISRIGGSNFEKALNETKRIKEYIDSNEELKDYNYYSTTYEQPYFQFENELRVYGRVAGHDTYQAIKPQIFMGPTTLKQMPFEDFLVHHRYQK